jgi:hypothetical protein
MLTGFGVLAFWVAVICAVAYFGWGAESAKKTHICTSCRTVAVPLNRAPGSAAITFILFLCGIVPGVIYSLWRHSASYKVCPACVARNPIPVDSPAAAALQSR